MQLNGSSPPKIPVSTTPQQVEKSSIGASELSLPSTILPSSLSTLRLTPQDSEIITRHFDSTFPAYVEAYRQADETTLANATLAIFRNIKNLGFNHLPVEFLMKSILEEFFERAQKIPSKILANREIIFKNLNLTHQEEQILSQLGIKNQLEDIARRSFL